MGATIQNITFSVFTTRVKRRLFNGYPSIAENVSDREIQLYFYEAAGQVMVRMSEKGMAMDGVRSIPEGFITTYKFTTFTKNDDTNYYQITLPQQPIGLPLGYSIIDPYFASKGVKSIPLFALDAHQRGYNHFMPTPNIGVAYFVENSTLYLDTKNISPNGQTLYVPMLSTRSATGLDSDIINVPDDAMAMIFDIVINKLTARLQVATDDVNDGVMHPTQKQ